ncbi:hypothetical protein K474DRAFT_1662571 [Panus rudis PR-1116 ss-1]|nr:hypothetical protein K474DRAFT_1662571 [Panus rudis PR-1116 ss-1]
MSTRHSFLSTAGLLRAPSSASAVSSHYAPSVAPERQNSRAQSRRRGPIATTIPTRAGVIPLGPTFIIIIAIIFSAVFISSISFAFIGAEEEPAFRDLLNDVANNDPGIVLIGENVDIDVDEPSVTIRWSIVGCGSAFMLSGSEGLHGSSSCGIPSIPLSIFVDGDQNPAATYDPMRIPFISSSGQRQSIQNLYQFDSDHVLDVHEARLYPFDVYHLTSTIHISNTETKAPVVISRLPTISQTSSFFVSTTDESSFLNSTSSSSDDPVQQVSRNLEMKIVRPPEARAFALLLFAANWMIAHASVAYLALAWKMDDVEKIIKYLILIAFTLLAIPQVRSAMPDAPGFDGVLIDSIGFFPQMLMSGFSFIAVTSLIGQRELRELYARDDAEKANAEPQKEAPAPISHGLRRLRLAGSSSSIDFRHMRGFSRNFSRPEPPTPIAE